MNIKISLPKDFLFSEVRNDYVVTTQMKTVWAVQLDLLNELKSVCEKYHLTYYADSGTLLGAIRHGGYIPWDDDIDIVMKRTDYDRLVELGKTEFDAPYFLQNAHSEMFPRGYSRLRNSATSAFTAFDLGKNINHGIFIDIFPLDNVPDDLKERKKWLKKIRLLYNVLKVGSAKRTQEYSGVFNAIKYAIYRTVFLFAGYSRLLELYESVCKKYNARSTQYISYVAYSRGKQKHIWERSCFDESYEVPFEFTRIRIPAGYDSRLKTEYNDYMKIVHSNSTHGSVVFDPNTPYSEFMCEHSDQEIEAILRGEKETL